MIHYTCESFKRSPTRSEGKCPPGVPPALKSHREPWESPGCSRLQALILMLDPLLRSLIGVGTPPGLLSHTHVSSSHLLSSIPRAQVHMPGAVESGCSSKCAAGSWSTAGPSRRPQAALISCQEQSDCRGGSGQQGSDSQGPNLGCFNSASSLHTDLPSQNSTFICQLPGLDIKMQTKI